MKEANGLHAANDTNTNPGLLDVWRVKEYNNESMLTSVAARLVSLSPGMKRALWKKWYDVLANRYQQAEWTFLNYGYANLEAGAEVLGLEKADDPNRYSIQLYHHVVREVDLHGLNVVEVGCGRGGGCSYLARYLKPRSMLGVDFAANEIAFCEKTHHVAGLSFRHGDAEALPLEDGTWDVVVNVESSHCYGSMENFLRQVFRVLKPGGHFLWADMRDTDRLDTLREQFAKSGLQLARETEITPNVLHALDLVNDWKTQAIQSHVPSYLRNSFNDFAGVKGAKVYEAFRSGKVKYLSCLLQKPAA